ncbi:hypothetical protein FDP41_009602 [Naegleria fowleri]|uniref:Uncharacterized protein n=1 Tax=Naegleria fowleri TaxID=5763 RepID=A0A6A5BB22_NAEFO|nr:hypothetical protein FDP41_009602 [Naegleria fowleri]
MAVAIRKGYTCNIKVEVEIIQMSKGLFRLDLFGEIDVVKRETWKILSKLKSLVKQMEKPLEVEENSVASNSIESISSRSLKFKKVYEFPSHTFIPVVPVEFELCSRNIGNKAFSAVFSDSLVSLAITYKDISSLDFCRVEFEQY